jgi:pSer/pThr/pTyr-binding forkhead associated (FHA) protein
MAGSGGVIRIAIGRDPACDVVVDDEYVSSWHAEVRLQGDTWSVIDLASKSGTMVDGRRVWTAPITRESVIRVGRTDLKAADLLPTAVAELHAVVAAEGYRQDDAEALRLLAGARVDAETAAGLLLTARRRGANPLTLARAVLRNTDT